MSDRQCELCQENVGKYICPRCNVMYCSVECYRAEKHLQCSERFYEKCVKEELKSRETDPNSYKKMLEILSRSRQLDEDSPLDSDDEEYDLAERMENVDLDNVDEIWEKLNVHERDEFENLVSSGQIIKLLPEWQPWWKKYLPKLINECKMKIPPEKYSPKVLADIPPFMKLTKRPPSASISFMISNVIMSYAFTTRWFKGNHFDMPVEAVTMIFALTATSRNNKIFQNFVEAYIAFEDDLLKCEWLVENKIDRNIICEDVGDIIKGADEKDMNFSLKACLSDIFNLIQKALQSMKKTTILQTRFTGEPPASKELKLFSKKIIYYLSWSSTHGNQLKDAFATCSFSQMI